MYKGHFVNDCRGADRTLAAGEMSRYYAPNSRSKNIILWFCPRTILPRLQIISAWNQLLMIINSWQFAKYFLQF